MSWFNLKTNWTSNDYYNAEDLNRVENNIKELEQIYQFLNSQFKLSQIIKSDRSYNSIEFADSLNRIESLIKEIKDAFITPPNFITPKTNWQALDAFSSIDANRLEQNLFLLYKYINNTINNLQYCGISTCGIDLRI